MPDDTLTQFESTVTGSATRIANLANLGAAPTAVLGFLAEGVFKGIRLGLAIRSKATEINAKLDSTIRARSFVRVPIVVDLGEVDFSNFYENKANIAAFPVLNEMSIEIAEFDSTGGLVSPATRVKLQAARALAEPLTDDPQLIRPGNAELRKMFAIAAINNAQLEAQQELNQAVRQLIRGAFLGDEGFASKALDLSTKLKKISIENQIKELQGKLADAPADKQADIQSQIDKLSAWKERLG